MKNTARLLNSNSETIVEVFYLDNDKADSILNKLLAKASEIKLDLRKSKKLELVEGNKTTLSMSFPYDSK